MIDEVEEGGNRGNGCAGYRTLGVKKWVSRDQHHSPVINIDFAFTTFNLK
jgi:hypothetical protein